MIRNSKQLKQATLRFCARCKGAARIATTEVKGAIGKFRHQCDEHAEDAARKQRQAEVLKRNISVRERAMLLEPPICFS